jgi:histone H1/5
MVLNKPFFNYHQAILKYIMANYKLGTDEKSVNTKLKTGLRTGLKKGAIRNSKGTGVTGSFRIVQYKK